MKVETISSRVVASLILSRRKESHKGSYGHILVIAGSRGMTGAAMLAAEGALRCGAGLVTAALPESQQPVVAAGIVHEAMTLGLPETAGGTLSRKACDGITAFVAGRKVSAVVLGPGLGNNSDTAALVRDLIISLEVPVVLDADGLNVIAGDPAILRKAKAGIVVTPHPGELGRLMGIDTSVVQKDREGSAVRFSRDTGAICVLKGYRTVVTDGNHVFINTTGNPGMATGGTGDVLAGMAAALTAQVTLPALVNAARCAVYLHGLSGDIAAASNTEIGLTAGALIASIPSALRKIVGKKRA